MPFRLSFTLAWATFFVEGGRTSEIGKGKRASVRVRLSVFKEIAYFSTFPELFRANFPRRRAFLPIFRHVALLARISNGYDDNVRPFVCNLFLAREGRVELSRNPKTSLLKHDTPIKTKTEILSEHRDYPAVAKACFSSSFRSKRRHFRRIWLVGHARSVAFVIATRAPLFSADVAKSICHACLPPILPPSPPSLSDRYIFCLMGQLSPTSKI